MKIYILIMLCLGLISSIRGAYKINKKEGFKLEIAVAAIDFIMWLTAIIFQSNLL